jgi:dTDP-4-dehydrorhamnose reductase
MKTILILGGTGMLGSAVGQYFQSKSDQYDVYLTARELTLAYGKKSNWIKFDPVGDTNGAASDIRDVLLDMPKNPDYIINCIGTIKPFMNKNIANSILINSVFPHILAGACKTLGIKLIHITTDCVFSGKKGQYTEADQHDALDDYGKSKSLGEPVANAMVIRTSIIGPEIHKQASLIAWAQSQAGKSVNGFANHMWNGITCKQYASICDQIIAGDLYTEGLHHVHSDTVSKFDLLNIINDRYNLELSINMIDAPEAIDRTLSTSKQLMSKLTIPPLREQIMSL